MTTPQRPHDSSYLDKLWQESAQDLAVAFLRRALHLDLNLSEVLAALKFDGLHADLAAIKLGDVLPRPAAPIAPQPRPAAAAPAARVGAAPRRRRPQQTQQIKTLLLGWIREAHTGIRTPELADKLRARGMGVDTATANLILKSMEEAGDIKGDQGRPRTWQAKTRGRLVPEPIVIRKAPERSHTEAALAAAPAAAPSAPAPVRDNVRAHAALLSQSEVQAAAAALRERFFAK